MLILSQKGDMCVNIDTVQCITEEISNKQHFRVYAWYGTTEDDCWILGEYQSETRAKEVIKEIWSKYGTCLHRQGGPAILHGSVDIQEAFWVLPKIYEMPEV